MSWRGPGRRALSRGRAVLRRREDHGLAELGPGSTIARPILGLFNPAGIAVGAGVEIRTHVWLEALCPPGEVVLRIGDGTLISHFARITALGGVTIGRHCLIGDRTFVSDSFHEYEDVERRINQQGMKAGRRVVIEDDVLLGIGSVVVGDVHIGTHALVGANAVVRSDVPAYSVVAGDPAVVVRRFVEGEWLGARRLAERGLL